MTILLERFCVSEVLSFLELGEFFAFAQTCKKELCYAKQWLNTDNAVHTKEKILNWCIRTVTTDLAFKASLWSGYKVQEIPPVMVLVLLMRNNIEETDPNFELARLAMQKLSEMAEDFGHSEMFMMYMLPEYQIIRKCIRKMNTNIYWYFESLLCRHSVAYMAIRQLWYVRNIRVLRVFQTTLIECWCARCLKQIDYDPDTSIFYLVCNSRCGQKRRFNPRKDKGPLSTSHEYTPVCLDCYKKE